MGGQFTEPRSGERFERRPRRNLVFYRTQFRCLSFFNMLYEITKEEKFLLASQNVLDWLNRHMLILEPYSSIKKGKGDSTIATDIYPG